MHPDRTAIPLETMRIAPAKILPVREIQAPAAHAMTILIPEFLIRAALATAILIPEILVRAALVMVIPVPARTIRDLGITTEESMND